MEKLKVQQLKEYLKNVFDLESSIYQTNQLKLKYQEKRANESPKEKNHILPSKPVEPTYLNANIKFSQALKTSKILYILWYISLFAGFSVGGAGLLIFAVFKGVYGSEFSGHQSLTYMFIIGGIGIIIFAYITYRIFKLKNEQQQEVLDQNKSKREKYSIELSTFERNCAEAQIRKEKAFSEYSKELTAYNYETTKTLQQLSDIEMKLKSSLYNLYSKNVIYAKYRNLVTIATLFEYIDSGRCFELEGPNGAYNLYEGELRADIIISSLNNIIANLESIKNNQYTLYESIEKANTITHEVLLNINNSQILTAYYAKQAALAASADRYMVGMMW